MKKHSVTLDASKCNGCTSCLKSCPTQAIRIRNGKSVIIGDKCIDCGECIRVCPHNARSAITDSLCDIKNYRYRVALIPPTLIGQFGSRYSISQIISSILELGFDYVQEVSYGAEIIGKALKYEINRNNEEIHISSSCPTVVKLICAKYPLLVENIMPLKAPIFVSAEIARKHLIEKYGCRSYDIGVFFITPCAAKATEIFNDFKYGGEINGAISIEEMYHSIMMNGISREVKEDYCSSPKGTMWEVNGGETEFLDPRTTLNVSGIDNIVRCLEDIDNGRFNSVKYIELHACVEGCVGGCLTVESPFVAKREIQIKANEMLGEISLDDEVVSESEVMKMYCEGRLARDEVFKPTPPLPLDMDRKRAIEMMNEISRTYSILPKIDCGSCGCPGCYSMAEDVVLGNISLYDCVILLKNRLSSMMRDMPTNIAPIRNDSKKERENENKTNN